MWNPLRLHPAGGACHTSRATRAEPNFTKEARRAEHEEHRRSNEITNQTGRPAAMAQSPDAWNMPQHPTTIDLGAHDHHHHQQHHHTHREDIQEWQFKATLLKKPSSHCRGGAKSKIRIPMLGESVEIICFSPSLGATFSHIASPLQRERH